MANQNIEVWNLWYINVLTHRHTELVGKVNKVLVFKEEIMAYIAWKQGVYLTKLALGSRLK